LTIPSTHPVSQCPGSEATLDPRVKNRLNTNQQVRSFRDELRVGNAAAFHNIYKRFAEKAIVPVPPSAEAVAAAAAAASAAAAANPDASSDGGDAESGSGKSLQQTLFANFVASCAP
jgi:hypothetical protein